MGKRRGSGYSRKIRRNGRNIRGEETWDWKTYVTHYEEMKTKYESVVSEYNGNRKNTVGLKDLTIIALAKTLKLPVVSSEKRLSAMQDSDKRQKIPDICDKEGVVHIGFNELLRAEGIKS
jgi:hypothetical protein